MKERAPKSERKKRVTNADLVMQDRFGRMRATQAAKLWGMRVFYVFTALFFCAVFVLICGSLFLRIKEITVTGNDFYDDKELIETSGVEEEQNLYAINKKKIESSIMMNYPYVKEVTVTRKLPTTLSFDIKVENPVYYVEISDEFFILSDTLRVLELCPSEAEAMRRGDGIKRLVAPQIIYAIVGQTVRFSSSSMFDYVHTMLTELSRTSLYSKLASVDVSDKFSIKAEYDGRFTVMLGTASDIAAKASFALGMINSFSDTTSGTVNAENIESGYAIVDSQSDLQ